MNLLLASDVVPSSIIQWGIATPLVMALGFVGKWLVKRLETVEQEKNLLYNKVINDVVPALKSSTDLAEKVLNDQRVLVTNEAIYVGKLETVNKQLTDLLRLSEDLRKQEISSVKAQRRGGG